MGDLIVLGITSSLALIFGALVIILDIKEDKKKRWFKWLL